MPWLHGACLHVVELVVASWTCCTVAGHLAAGEQRPHMPGLRTWSPHKAGLMRPLGFVWAHISSQISQGSPSHLQAASWEQPPIGPTPSIPLTLPKLPYDPPVHRELRDTCQKASRSQLKPMLLLMSGPAM